MPDDERDADPAAMEMVGRNVVEALRNDGYTVQPAYTGQRGGGLLFQILPFLGTTIASALNYQGILPVVFKVTTPIITYLLKWSEKRTSQDSQQRQPIKITLEIDGIPITVEAADLETAESAFTLAQRFHSAHPTVEVTPNSTIKVKGRVPKSQPRRRK